MYDYAVKYALLTHKFTGKERDNESGLDDFEARFYGSSLGRFTSPDPLFMNYDRLTDPQQLNLYSYVRNNPLNLTDPTGLDVTFQCKTDADCKEAGGDLNNRKGKEFDVTVGRVARPLN